MRRRTRSKPNTSLIGFLDIISVLVVLILLILSILSLSQGITNSPNQSRAANTLMQDDIRIRVSFATGMLVTSPVSLMMCDKDRLYIYGSSSDPSGNAKSIHSTTKVNDLRDRLIVEIESRVYLAVKPSCMDRYKSIVSIINSLGSSVGYEPIEEDADVPWREI